jgi:hypothetical protein
MSKRNRGARSGRPRPTQPRPARPANQAVATSPAAAVTPDAAPTGVSQPLPDKAAVRSTRSARSGGLLATKAANEYVYVERDLRRIAIVGGSMFGFMAVLWLLVDVTKIVKF